MLAVQNGRYDVVDNLLGQGVDVSIPNGGGKTLLDLAEQQSNYWNNYTLLPLTDSKKIFTHEICIHKCVSILFVLR